jgi:Fe(3+) dicitrate transport protein
VLFSNFAFIHSEYKQSENAGVTGNEVEFVPHVNLKTGLRLGFKNFKASVQYSYLSSQYTDATNSTESDASAVVGIIPEYSIIDLSLSYQFKKFRIEGNVNNLADRMYFTRRATGYPGPGILPSDGRSFYLSLQLKL